MKKIGLMVLCLLIASCSYFGDHHHGQYRCGSKTVTVSYLSPSVAKLQINGKEHKLKSVSAASGSRYMNNEGTMVFWNKGQKNYLEINGHPYPGCVMQES